MVDLVLNNWFLDEKTLASSDFPLAFYAINEVLSFFASQFLDKDLCRERVLIINDVADGPRTNPKRYPVRYPQYSGLYDTVIELGITRLLQGQLVFQLAHEMSHFLMDCYPDTRMISLQWIPEVLSEASSLVTLFSLSGGSATPLSVECGKFHSRMIKATKQKTISRVSLRSNIDRFRADPRGQTIDNLRARNVKVAVPIADFILNNPLSWHALSYAKGLPLGVSCDDITFLTQWSARCPDPSLVRHILSLL